MTALGTRFLDLPFSLCPSRRQQQPDEDNLEHRQAKIVGTLAFFGQLYTVTKGQLSDAAILPPQEHG